MSDLENKMNDIAEEALSETKEDIKTENAEKVVETPVVEETAQAPTEEVKEEKVIEPVEKADDTEETTETPVVEEPIKVHRGQDGFVSETFSNLLANEEAMEEISKTSPKNILSNIQVNLNSIEIVNELNPIEMNNLENAILNDTTTMLVTCCQSSYTAEMSALKSQEIQSISNSDVDYYSYKKKLFQTINKHMENTSVGKMDYANWLHLTSYFDVDTLLYGIYCQTFNYENKYSVTCPSCGKSFDAVVNNNTLIELRGRDEGAEVFSKIQEIVSSVKNADELLEKSQVHKTKRICLDESKIIVDIKIPSAYDYLEDVVAKADNEALEDYQNAIGLTLFVDSVYLPNVLLYQQTGKLNYVKLNASRGKMLTVVSDLSYYDSLQLTDEINDFVEKYRVTYSIRNVGCPNCGYIIKNIPLDMEEVLFSTIRLGRRGR
jgi:hypothetical protein